MIWQQLAIVIMALALGGLLGGYLTLILLRDEDEGGEYVEHASPDQR